jgi:hypothetical protein
MYSISSAVTVITLKSIRFNKIVNALIRSGPLFILCFILTFLLNGCLSLKETTGMVRSYDARLIKQHSTCLELPAGINLNLQNPLPDSSSVKKSYMMVLPLVVVNYFQTNHKLTLGESSLDTPTAELFKSELLSNLKRLEWNVLYNNGYSIDIDVHKINSTGIFASGYLAVIAASNSASAGKGGEISHSMRIQSEAFVSMELTRDDNILIHRDFIILVKTNGYGKLKIEFTDRQYGQAIAIPTSLPRLVPIHAFEDLIPSTKKVYSICSTMVCCQIVNLIENYLAETFSQ